MSIRTFIDSHVHLDDEQFTGDLDAVLTEAGSVGVSAFVNIGYGPKRWSTTLALAAKYPHVHYTLGLHPVSTDEWSPQTFAALKEFVRTSSPVAIGEIGLDYYWTTENKYDQRSSFEAQIELAIKADIPIVIHQRNSAADVAAILRNAPLPLRAVLHSFDGNPDLTTLVLERGWMVGVGGLMTRRQNEVLRQQLRLFPLDQIMLETDAPWLVPSGLKTRRNSPASIPLIAERLASIRGQEVDEIALATTRSATDFFRLKVPVVSA